MLAGSNPDQPEEARVPLHPQAEAFLATRLDHRWGGAFGTLPVGLDLDPILERALVHA